MGGSIRVINHAVAAREEEIDSFLAARAIGKTATIYTQQVALRRVRYFCVLTRIENHHAGTAKNEENYRRRTRQNTHEAQYQIKGRITSQSARVKIGESRVMKRVPVKFTS